MEAIKQANEEPETSAAVKARMQELQKQHTEEVRTLYEWHAQDYYDEMLDLSRSENDYHDTNAEVRAVLLSLPRASSPWRSVLKMHECTVPQAFYRRSRACFDLSTAFDDELDRHHYAHLSTMVPLAASMNFLRVREETQRKWREQQFPATIAAFHNNPHKEVQVRSCVSHASVPFMLIEFAAAPGGEVLDLGRGRPGAFLDRVRLDVAAGRASP